MTDEELMRAALDEAKIAADLAPTTCVRAAKMPPTTPS